MTRITAGCLRDRPWTFRAASTEPRHSRLLRELCDGPWRRGLTVDQGKHFPELRVEHPSEPGDCVAVTSLSR
jgi:hypothetical protein